MISDNSPLDTMNLISENPSLGTVNLLSENPLLGTVNIISDNPALATVDLIYENQSWRRCSFLHCTMTIQLSALYVYVMFQYVYSSASLSWTLIRDFVETLKQTFGQHCLSQDNSIIRMFRSEIRSRHDSDLAVVGFYNYLCNQFLSPLMWWVRTSFMARCTRYSTMRYILSVTCNRSVVFFGYSGFLHQ
jgi:hypothetical protein